MKKILFISLLLTLTIPILSFAHPGRTDSSGCHTCRTNCSNWGLSTGEYHCHNAKALPQPKEPIKSTYGEQGTGYTTPAPEYKTPITNTVKTQLPVKTTPTEIVTPNPIVKPTLEINKEEKQIIPSVINEVPNHIVIPASPVTEIKKPSIIKRFFSWLF